MAISDFGPDESQPTTYPLHPVDPPKIGDFWPEARLYASSAGVAYLATEDHATAPVMVILLSQGAAADPAARDRLAGEVDRMDIDTVIARGGLDQDAGDRADKFRSEDDDPHSVDGIPQAPWVALAYDQTSAAVTEAKRVLGAVELNDQTGIAPVGPDYRLHWADQAAPGLTHVWPLPWPGRRQRGGRLSILASWLLMLLLAATAVLIAILIFSQAPPTPPPPPIPTEATGTGGATSSPNETSSPSESDTASASPSPTEGSPSPTGTETVGQTNTPPLPI